ncbi:class I SAM-dependent methyltransferase [Nonomuraea antimicrobica]
MSEPGTGPGPITPDGSPVDFYTLLGPGADPEIVAQVTPPGGSVLELGAGVGRVTHPLVDRGFQVVAVDESPEMLAHIRGARTVHARVQELRLGERFDTVVLASQLVNTAHDQTRRELVAACARHVRPGGTVLIQWMPAEAHDRWHVGMGRQDGDLTITMAAVEEVSPASSRRPCATRTARTGSGRSRSPPGGSPTANSPPSWPPRASGSTASSRRTAPGWPPPHPDHPPLRCRSHNGVDLHAFTGKYWDCWYARAMSDRLDDLERRIDELRAGVRKAMRVRDGATARVLRAELRSAERAWDALVSGERQPGPAADQPRLVTVREQVHQGLRLLGATAQPRLVVAVGDAFFGGTVRSGQLTSLRRTRSARSGPRRSGGRTICAPP